MIAKKFVLIIIIIVGGYGAISFPFLHLANFEGDLTRMAMLPEDDFGWLAPQPGVDKTNLVSARWQDADVLVIGDSFSEKLIWQSKLVESGLKVRTESWSNIGAICEDFDGWLQKNQFRGRYIIIQSVENSFAPRLKKSIACKKINYKFLKPKEIAVAQERNFHNPVFGGGQLDVGIRTWLNKREYAKKANDPEFKSWRVNKNVSVRRMQEGCELFSHKRCNDVLFFELVGMGNPDDVNNDMVFLQNRIKEKNIIWLVIPDKETVYLERDTSFWKISQHQSKSIDVIAHLHKAVNDKEVDLYFGNDTHLSPKGYGIVGKAVLDYLKLH
jgi:hypothetical protein